MCGIVGILSRRNVVSRLVDGLKRLEYRGYDSSGIATLTDNSIERRRTAGKIANLEALLQKNPLEGTIGIAHTRWATHGEATTCNAHPHANGNVVIVHNGIIENFLELREELTLKGYSFESQTDTEVVVHLIDSYLTQGLEPFKAVQETFKRLHGAFAFVILFKDYPDLMIATRQGSPLVLGYGDDEVFLGSDALALAPWTKELVYLVEKDIAVIERSTQKITVSFFDALGQKVERLSHKSKISVDAVSKGTYNHFMLKEIYEQPKSLSETINSLIDFTDNLFIRPCLQNIDFTNVRRIAIVACGTSYYAGMVAKYWFETKAKISVDVDIASEFRYRDPVLSAYDLVIVISQSGETIDTLYALRLAKQEGVKTLAILNVEESSIGREADHLLLTQVGPEIGVASTKAFTGQLVVLAILSLYASKAPHEDFAKIIQLPSLLLKVLELDQVIQRISDTLIDFNDVLYLGRGTNYPVSLEGALKLKEISYIHAEAYPAGELKHGPIALVYNKLPIIVVVPFDKWFEKTVSNIQEVLARGAHVIAITDHAGATVLKSHKNVDIIELPVVSDFMIDPILYTIPIQLLAYYTAFYRGTDIDQPRNLAKSVTVE